MYGRMFRQLTGQMRGAGLAGGPRRLHSPEGCRSDEDPVLYIRMRWVSEAGVNPVRVPIAHLRPIGHYRRAI